MPKSRRIINHARRLERYPRTVTFRILSQEEVAKLMADMFMAKMIAEKRHIHIVEN